MREEVVLGETSLDVASFFLARLFGCLCHSLSLSLNFSRVVYTIYLETTGVYGLPFFDILIFFFFSLNKDTNFFFFLRCALQLNLNLSKCLYICSLEEIKIVLLAHYSLIKRFKVQFLSTPKTDWYFGIMIKSKIIKSVIGWNFINNFKQIIAHLQI